ncbi:MAG: MBL fold metallo-hydrolase [Chloroflexi bacterium]|nr:MBL fold metallo-hydrolase [Chloroflexota bacterium]MCY3581125.1 MBL fold metallo-hydrolase [Chloroflexota bacterium]MCY3715598.1 MBL fold metallo-hydrolase [Chloroflexota bacterium]MDE2650664.1 MBL fold metallo-hydrolase [Chloroflexota bacterium]
MRLTSDLHVVGGGYFGFGLSGHLDCHVFVLNSGGELALIDPGLGTPGDFDTILDNIRGDGLDPRKIRKLILTHYHCDHIGAAAEAQERLDVEVYASAIAAPAIRTGDERAVALDAAKAANFYPDDYVLPPCPVDVELHEGDVVKIGNLQLETFDTPGHCDGHLSFIMSGGDRSYLLGADLVFWGGKVLWQNIHDCRIDAYANSMFKMEGQDFDALVPGHLQISLRGGKVHLQAAAQAFRQLGIPPNLL